MGTVEGMWMTGSKCKRNLSCVSVRRALLHVWAYSGDPFAKADLEETDLTTLVSVEAGFLLMHLSFTTVVRESHLIISLERTRNFGGFEYSTAAFVKDLLEWIQWILISPEVSIAVICSLLRRVHGGFLNDNIVMHQCHTIALALKHYRLLRCSSGPIPQ